MLLRAASNSTLPLNLNMADDGSGHVPIMAAAQRGSVECIELLLAAAAAAVKKRKIISTNIFTNVVQIFIG
jgi:hypothetical protein